MLKADIEKIKKKNVYKYVDSPITFRNFKWVPHPLIHFIVHSIQLFKGFYKVIM